MFDKHFNKIELSSWLKKALLFSLILSLPLSFLFVSETGSHYETQADLEFMILVAQPPRAGIANMHLLLTQS